MRHTEITIKHGKETTKFRVNAEAGLGMLNFLRGLQNSEEQEMIPAEEAFPDLKDPLKRIGIIFRGIRHRHNLTQREVATRLGIDQSDVSKIEKGKRPLGKALAKKVEKEFGIDYRRLL